MNLKPMRFLPLMIAAGLLSACNVEGLEPPLIVSVRPSRLEKGLVFNITNKSPKFLHGLTVQVREATEISHTSYVDTIEPHGTVSIGWLELNNWEPTINSTLIVSVEGYLLDSGPWSSKGAKVNP